MVSIIYLQIQKKLVYKLKTMFGVPSSYFFNIIWQGIVLYDCLNYFGLDTFVRTRKLNLTFISIISYSSARVQLQCILVDKNYIWIITSCKGKKIYISHIL